MYRPAPCGLAAHAAHSLAMPTAGTLPTEAPDVGQRQVGDPPQVVLHEKRSGRAMLRSGLDLKIEFVNDVPPRVGEPVMHPVLGLLDTKENILANKITALVDREDPKDLADVSWLCCRDGLSLQAALEGAEGKAAGVFPPLVAKRLAQGAEKGVPDVYWIQAPAPEEFAEGIQQPVDWLLCL